MEFAPFNWDLFRSFPVIGILRGFSAVHLKNILPATRAGGLANLEITMNTPDAAAQIETAAALARGEINIGAGTVTSLAALQVAISAGANFIVTPVVQEEVIHACCQRNIPVFPGAFSPGEIVRAWELGASMVKVFPADAAGPGFIRSLKGPLPNIRLLPTGGIDLDTLREYLNAGADGFGIGSPLFNKARIESGDWLWLQDRCRAFRTHFETASRADGTNC